MRVAYVVSRFPSTTETFIAREMGAVEDLGISIELFALIRERDVVVHPEAEPFLRRLRTAPLWRLDTLRAQWYWMRRRPKAYFSAWWDATRGNRRSPRFLLRAWIVVPKAARFAREAEKQRVEHVHAHWATHPALAAYVIGRLVGIPFSFTAHAHDIFVNRTMLREKLSDATFVAVISSFNREYLVRHYGERARRKLVVVRCGVDTERFTREIDCSTRPEGFRIACVASLQPHKGHHVLIDALARLRDRHVPFECVLAGEGAERAAIEEQIRRLDLADRVSLVGAVRSGDVLRIVKTADVVVLSSVVVASGQMEGIPVALMEALACEVPVVASRLSGIPELVIDGETGLLVDAGDADALAGAIERLSRDPALRRRLGAAGRARVVSEFGERASAERLVALFASGQ
jgi:colanic acid/amylovoran biosynthesis glycosyltransferase